MEQILKECQQDIAVIQRKLKKLKSQPKTATRDAEIIQWETMLYDVMGKAAQIRKYMKGGDKVSGQ